VMSDASLWPAKVKILRGMSLKNPDGQSLDLPAGTSCTVVNFDEQGVFSVPDNVDARLNLNFANTDMLDSARERAAMEPAQRNSRIIDIVREIMVDSSGKPFTHPGLDETKVFVFYYGAGWCKPCQLMSPELVKWVKANAASNPHMTVIMLSGDEKESEMLAYMKERKMPWPAVAREAWLASPVFKSMSKGTYPQLLITDRFGKVIYNEGDADREQIEKHLAALQKVSESGAAK